MSTPLPAGWGGTYHEPKALAHKPAGHNKQRPRRSRPRRQLVGCCLVPYDSRTRSTLGLFICGRWYDL